MNDDRASRRLLEAVSFAARAHDGQRRKDRQTPYASHPFRVCLIVRHVFGIADPAVLAAAVLHDTIEDTPTDFDDLAERFGTDVAGWAAMLSKDMRLPEADRERAYKEALARAPWQVKMCKLGDMYDNLLDSGHLSGDKRLRTFRRCRGYLAALDAPDLPDAARQAHRRVTELLDGVESTPQK
jgi:guanosine-3',5'-bis(diphosphate) 3'-pyrophosphohydrolase